MLYQLSYIPEAHKLLCRPRLDTTGAARAGILEGALRQVKAAGGAQRRRTRAASAAQSTITVIGAGAFVRASRMT